jgi:hypothetical protein
MYYTWSLHNYDGFIICMYEKKRSVRCLIMRDTARENVPSKIVCFANEYGILFSTYWQGLMLSPSHTKKEKQYTKINNYEKRV